MTNKPQAIDAPFYPIADIPEGTSLYAAKQARRAALQEAVAAIEREQLTNPQSDGHYANAIFAVTSLMETDT